MSELMEMAKKENFEVKVTNKGFAFIPLINGKVISEREYDNLDREKKEVIVAKASILKKKAEVVLVKIKDIEVKSISKLKEVYSDFLTKEIGSVLPQYRSLSPPDPVPQSHSRQSRISGPHRPV